MDKKKIILLGIVVLLIILVILAVRALFFKKQENSPQSPLSIKSITKQKVEPSTTYIEYTDPTGFKFNYPDNLSLSKQEIEDSSIYASLVLNANGVNGSLNLEIADSKYKSLDEWIKAKAISQTPKEVKLGNLKALEVKTSDRLLLAALDQGVLFTIEIPRVEEDFWMKVYDKFLEDFSFASSSDATPGTNNASSGEISFEGEEVVE